MVSVNYLICIGLWMNETAIYVIYLFIVHGNIDNVLFTIVIYLYCEFEICLFNRHLCKHVNIVC